MSTDIDQYRLPGKAGEPLRIATDHWYCKGLYLSSVCMAVHLKPTAKTLADSQGQAEVRDDLRTLMRGLGQRLLEFNLWRPLVGVLEDDGKRFTALAADQEWHRGDFLLFVEAPDKAATRIADLLEPGDQLPVLQQETTDPHTTGWFRRNLDEALSNSPVGDTARELLDRVLPPPKSGQPWKSAAEPDIQKGFEAWTARIKNEAEDIALRGDKP